MFVTRIEDFALELMSPLRVQTRRRHKWYYELQPATDLSFNNLEH